MEYNLNPNSVKETEAKRPLAMITGGTRGVGAGIAEEFVKDGYNVILGYRANVDAAKTFKEHLLTNYGGPNNPSQQNIFKENVGFNSVSSDTASELN